MKYINKHIKWQEWEEMATNAGHEPEKGQYGGNPPHLSDLFIGLRVGTHVDQTLHHRQEEVHIVTV